MTGLVTGPVIALALTAAVLHASWNAFLRSGADRLWSATVMSIVMALIAVPFALLGPLPPAAAWPYLVASSGLQVGYSFFLVAAYRYGQLGQVYPIVRGTAPVLVTIGGFLIVGQGLSVSSQCGVLLIGVGIMSLARGRPRPPTTSILFAFLTGCIIAGYALVDSKGVRVAGDSIVYTSWLSLLYGLLLPVGFIAVRRSVIRVELRSRETLRAVAGGAFSLVAYAAVMAAFALGPAGPITALRETSVIFAVLIGWVFLDEPLTARRVGACVVVVAGAVLLM